MNTDDLIYVVQNQLEKDFCKHVIEKFKTDEDKYQGLIGRGLDLNVKQSMDLTISDRDDWKEEDEVFFQSLTRNIQAYKDWVPYPYEHYVCDRDRGLWISNTKTQPRWVYKWHHDGLGSRMLTFIWYLNDITRVDIQSLILVSKFNHRQKISTGLLWVHRGVAPIR